MRSDATSSATMPALVASTQTACPTTMPNAVKMPPLRPPMMVLRTVSAVSGPGVTMTRIDMLRNARKDVFIVCLQSRLQRPLPGLADEIGAERVVRFFRHEPEARGLIDAARGGEDALRPQRHRGVAGAPGEAQAL